MYITFNELRKIKHSLPTGSVKRIADELKIDEQSVRNYFGAMKYNSDEEIVGKHIQPGPEGGIVNLEDTEILDLAKKILEEANIQI
jgi:type II secretory pathway component PulC